MSNQDFILTSIKVALRLHGVSATQFGYLAVGDPGILKRLRDGRQARPALLKKLQRHLDQLEDGTMV